MTFLIIMAVILAIAAMVGLVWVGCCAASAVDQWVTTRLARRASVRQNPIEVLGTLSPGQLVHLGEENLAWWNHQRKLMGLRSDQQMPVPSIWQAMARQTRQGNHPWDW